MRCLLFVLCGWLMSGNAWANYELIPKLIAENTYMLEGSTDNFSAENGGNVVNTAFVITEVGVVVIDTGPSRAYGEALRFAIASITDLPVVQVFLTHHHPDHVLGNQAFADVPIAALTGTQELLREQGDHMAENMYRIVGDWMRGTEVLLPTEVVEPQVLDIGGHTFQIMAFTGHSGADMVLLDQRTGVLFAGDMVFYRRALATPNTASLSEWLADLNTLQALPWKVVLPGHGPLATDDKPFVQTQDYLTWLDKAFREAAQQGMDMNEVMRLPIPERFADISLAGYELVRTVSHLYPHYEQEQWQRID